MKRMEIWLEGNLIHDDEGPYADEEEAEIAFRQWVKDTVEEWSYETKEKSIYTVEDFEFELYDIDDEEE